MVPSLLAAGLLLPGLACNAAPLPQLVRACSRSTVEEFLNPLGSTDANGMLIPMAGSGSAIHRSRPEDPVEPEDALRRVPPADATLPSERLSDWAPLTILPATHLPHPWPFR
jgi:hypothetical protein